MNDENARSWAMHVVAWGFVLFLLSSASTTHYRVEKHYEGETYVGVSEIDALSLTKDPVRVHGSALHSARERAALLVAVSLFAVIAWWVVVFGLAGASQGVNGFPSPRSLKAAAILTGLAHLLIVAAIVDLPPFE